MGTMEATNDIDTQGYWTTDASHERGTSIIVFNTQRAAEDAAARARSTPPPAGVTIASAEVVEVTGEARGAIG